MTVVGRPLPGTPSKIPTIINKVIGGGKSKAEKERRKREEKEERERQRMEKEKGKKEEKAKSKEKKTKSEQEQSEAGTSSGRQSLFQRLFTRSKSMTEDDVNANAASDQNPPAVPKHRDRIRQFRFLEATRGGIDDVFSKNQFFEV